jgi:hypothetical protein
VLGKPAFGGVGEDLEAIDVASLLARPGLGKNSWLRNMLNICGAVHFPMVETRIAQRHRVSKPAIANDGGDKYTCTVRDLSATGAAIEFSDPFATIPIAKAFTLILKDDGLRLPCRIVWKRVYRMGVTFD